MAGPYLVTLDTARLGRTLKNGCNAMLVYANDDTAAKEACAAKFDGDGAAWTSNEATATAIAAGTDFNGWTLKVSIFGATFNKTFSVVGDVTNNTIDEIAALMVIALNADAAIAGAAYNSTSQVLKVAETTDNLGAHDIAVELIPPNGYSSIASLIGTIVDHGIAGAVLSAVLPADAAVIPSVPIALTVA